jgi:hypothetical protein
MARKDMNKREGDRVSRNKMRVMVTLCAVFAVGIGYYIFFANADKAAPDENDAIQVTDQLMPLDIADAKESIQNKLKDPPEEVKALYLTGWSAGNAKKMDGVIDLIGKEKLNAVVIDIKDYSGYVSYKTGIEEISKYKAEQIMIPDVDALLKKLHEKNIYAIARITVFQDPVLANARPDLAIKSKATGKIWKDNKGLAWIDPASNDAWGYITKIAKDASDRGFDEINFDYVRFPSDGSLGNMSYPFYKKEEKEKHEVIREFFSYLRTNLPGITISADLFGLATINDGDLGIGQTIEDAYENFDYVCPMVYPSHYADGFNGYKNPAEYPYEIVKYSMDKGMEKLAELEKIKKEENPEAEIKLAKLRPWLQAFDMGAVYGPAKIKAQIKASNEAGGVGWILWNASNNYTSRTKGIND